MSLPFLEEQIGENIFIREFDPSDESEFAWHQDEETRVIELLEGEGWSIQVDNSSPVLLLKGVEITIKAKYWHKIIKGENKCKIKIQKFYTY